MQEKYDSINISFLSVEIFQDIAAHLPAKDATHFALASKDTFFNVERILIKNKKAHDICTFVAFGKQEEAAELLTKSPNAQELLLTHVLFTDYSGRTFNCTAYEYAYWAKDTHMRRMLEKQMDANTKTNMLKRCEVIESDGLTYKQHGVEVKDSNQFNFTPLKKALKNYIDGFNKWINTCNWMAMKEGWTQIGIVQRDIPAHVANEYCRKDRSFAPTPKFNEDNLPRELTFYNFITEQEDAWFPVVVSDSSALEVGFVLFRGNNQDGARAVQCEANLGIDLAAIHCLDEVRTGEN